MRSSSRVTFPSRSERPSSGLATASGCSWISFSMKELKPPFVGGCGVPVDVVFLALGRGAEEVGDLHRVGGDGDDLVLADLHGAAGVLDERRTTSEPRKFSPSPSPITSGELRRAPTTTPGWSACTASRVNAPSRRLAGELHGLGQAAVGEVAAQLGAEDIAQEHGRDLGVGLGRERSALGQQVQLELGEVLDDAVVDEGELAAVGQVRVRVLVGGAAVRGPAGVADAGRSPPAAGAPRGRRAGCQLAGLLAGLDGRRPETTATPAES